MLEPRVDPHERGPDDGSSDALRLVWERISSRIDALLEPADRLTARLLEERPSEEEMAAGLEALDELAVWIADLGMVAAARLTRSLRRQFESCLGEAATGALVADAVTAAGIIEDLRSSVGTTGAGGSLSGRIGDRLLVVGPPGLLVDSLIWFAATSGFTVEHSADMVNWPASADVVVVIDAESPDGSGQDTFNPLLASRSASERFAVPLVCVTHRRHPADRAALAHHAASLLGDGVRPADIVDEVRRVVHVARRIHCLAVRGEGSERVVDLVGAKGVEAWSAGSDEELLAGLESGRASGLLLLPSEENADLIRLLRVQPTTRRLVIVEVLDEEGVASSVGVDALIDSVDEIGRQAGLLRQLLRQRADLDVDLTPATRTGGVPWASAAFLAERVLLAAHRAESVASLCVIRHDPAEPLAEIDAVQDALMREFRTDDVVTRSGDRENILVLGGVDRQVAQARLEAIVAGAIPGARVGIAEFPFDAQSVDELVDAARDVLDRSAGHRLQVVSADWHEERAAAAEVLVADSDQASAHVVAQVVERCGMTVDHVVDGQVLLDRLRDPSVELPRLVVLDFDLLTVDGLTILRRLHHQGALRRFDVVMLSSRTRESDIRQAYDLGVVEVIEKPFSPGIVARRLLRLLAVES